MGESTPADRRDASGPAGEDGLTKGLPGLPVRLRDHLVDDAGFHLIDPQGRKQLFVRWDEVTAVRHYPFIPWLSVEVAEPDGEAKAIIRTFARRKARSGIVEAWREYLLRRLEHDGVLRGRPTPFPSSKAPFVVAVTAYALLMLLGIVLFNEAEAIAWNAAFGMAQRVPNDAVRAATRQATSRYGLFVVLAMAISLLVRGFVGVLMANSRHWERRQALHRWRKWGLSRDGLLFWPGGERKTVRPAAGDVISPTASRIAGQPVWPGTLSGAPVLMPILLAMGERGGAMLRPAVRMRVLLALAAASVVLAGVLSLEIVTGRNLWRIAVLTALLGMTVLSLRALLAERRRLPKLVAEGRAILERLGW